MRRNFTIVELITVISIIAIIAALLLPSLEKARNRARLTECMSNLHQTGTAFASYMAEYRDMFPIAAMKPTVAPTEPRIADVLHSYAGNNKIFRCPLDIIPEKSYTGNTEERTFFEAEGCSYEYASMLGGRKLGNKMGWDNMSSAKRVVMFDYECFHKRSGLLHLSQDESGFDNLSVAPKGGSKNYLFADWHVSDKI